MLARRVVILACWGAEGRTHTGLSDRGSSVIEAKAASDPRNRDVAFFWLQQENDAAVPNVHQFPVQLLKEQ